MRANPESSRRDAEAALALLEHQPDADLEIRARLVLCDYLSERNKAEAEQQISAASSLLPQATRPGLRAGVLSCRGEILEMAGDNSAARRLYEQAVAIATAEHDDEMLAGALFQRGYLLGLQGEYAAGLSDLREAQSRYERIGMPDHALTTLNGIAILYNRMGDYAQARHIYDQALRALRKAGLKREEAVTLYNLGRAHENLEEWQQAQQAFEASLAISRRIGYGRGEAHALRGLATVATSSGRPLQALDILVQAESLQRRTPDARLRAQILLTRGIALHQLGRLAESQVALEEAVDIFRQADAVAELAAAHAALASVHADAGNWRQAYEYYREYKTISDTLFSRQLDQRFATLKVEFDTAAKERENALLLRENAATEKALAEQRRAGRLQLAVIALTAILALLLASLAIRQRRASLRLRALAMTDELTGVPNRRNVLGQLERLLAREPTPLAILIIDIDHFKSINDLYGHGVGDEVLKTVATVLRSAVREPACVGRLGGEEFVIVLPDTGLEDALRVAERIRHEVTSIDTGGWFADRQVTVSIGATVGEPGETRSKRLLERADAALYAAKHAGRNCVRSMPAATTLAA